MTYKIEHNKHVIELPDFKQIPVGIIRKVRGAENEDAMWVILESLLTEEQLAVVDSMPLDEFTTAVNGWTQGANLPN